MIIEIKVANYRSINAEQTLSFVADRATRHPDNLIKRPGYRLLKAVGMFGANASGKSNFVKAIRAMSLFVRDSAKEMNSGDPILAYEPYRLDPQTRNAASHFEITFVTDGIVYTYGFRVSSVNVYEEWLTAKTETSEKETLSFRRTWSGATGQYIWEFSPQLEPLRKLFIDRTRSNALALSVADRENVIELQIAYSYFRDNIGIFDMSMFPNSARQWTWMQIIDKVHIHQNISALLRDADIGDIDIKAKYAESHDTPQVNANFFPGTATLDQYLNRANARLDQQKIVFTRRDNDGLPVEFDLDKDESNGTQRLFGLAGVFLDALSEGKFLVIDELDASMHPLLTRKLLELFQSPEANPNGAQLLFTTHDAIMLDQVLFRRDQICLAEKRGGASVYYSLADMHPSVRNDKAFLHDYLAGRYGGTPQVGGVLQSPKLGIGK